MKVEPDSWVWTLETADDSVKFSSREEMIKAVKKFKQQHPNTPHRTGRYRNDEQARFGHCQFKASLSKMDAKVQQKLFAPVIDLTVDDDDEDDIKVELPESVHGINSDGEVSNETPAESVEGLTLEEIDPKQVDNADGVFYGVFTKEGPSYFHGKCEAEKFFADSIGRNPNLKAVITWSCDKNAARKQYEALFGNDQKPASKSLPVVAAKPAKLEHPTPLTPDKDQGDRKIPNIAKGSWGGRFPVSSSPIMKNPYKRNISSIMPDKKTSKIPCDVPVTFDGELFQINPLVLQFIQRRVELDITVFYPGDIDVWDIELGAANAMVSIDLKEVDPYSIGAEEKSFWLFKPQIFSGMSFIKDDGNRLPPCFENMMATCQRKVPFGSSEPLVHSGKSVPFKHELLVTWLPTHPIFTIKQLVDMFLEEWATYIMLPSYQHLFYRVAKI